MAWARASGASSVPGRGAGTRYSSAASFCSWLNSLSALYSAQCRPVSSGEQESAQRLASEGQPALYALVVREMIINRTCTQCGASRDKLDDATECQCGSVAKIVQGTATATIRVTGRNLESSLVYEGPRPWHEQWLTVLNRLERLRDAYDPLCTLSSDDMKRQAHDFFVECWTLKDWLQSDDVSALPASKAVLDGYCSKESPLRVCQAMANVKKHRQLDSPEKLSARISRLTQKPTGRALTITYGSSVEPDRHVDALDLAEQSVNAWRRFLRQHGLTQPA
jgi:hypothetical protein